LITSLEFPSSEEVLLECKHFFSGAALYANGKICVSLTPVGFGLKLPAVVRLRLIEEGDGRELRYFVKAPVKKEYVALSQTVVDDRQRLGLLINQSIKYVGEGVVAGR
jgi:TfoX/Sxy family transcriptional regulator of competence genes